MKEFKRNLEAEFEEKKQQLLGEVKKSPDDELFKENRSLRDKIQSMENELFASKKQIEFVAKENKSLQQDLGLKAGFIETMQLQSQAAIEDEKSKMKILMGESQIAMKTYFEDRIASRDRDNSNLK